MTKLEEYLMRGLPADWTDAEAQKFAKRYAPNIQESINAAIRHETARKAGKHADPNVKRWDYRLRDVMPDAD